MSLIEPDHWVSPEMGYYSGEIFKIHKDALDHLKVIMQKLEEEKELMKIRRKLAFSRIVGRELVPIVRTFSSEEHDWAIFKSTIRYCHMKSLKLGT